MSEEEFQHKYGYDTDPVVLWEEVGERIKLDLGWAFEEDFRDWDHEDWHDFHEDIVRGLESIDHFIEDEYGPAVREFEHKLRDYWADVKGIEVDDLDDDDWQEFKRQIFKGITRLQEMARNYKLKASGALRNTVMVNSQKWEEMQKALH